MSKIIAKTMSNEEMAKAQIKRTGFFAIVHYGADGKQTLPCYLRNDYQNSSEPFVSIDYFTFNLGRASLFADEYAAVQEAEKVRNRLAEHNHPLAKRINVVECLVVDRRFTED